MALDPSIILQSQGVKLDDPLTIQAKRAQLSDLLTQNQGRQMQLQQAQQEQSQQQTLADLYKNSLGDNGQLDRNKLYTGAAQAGLGNRIPGLQKNFADADKTQADVGHVKAQTGETDIKTLKAKLDISSGAISSLLADRNVNNDKVISTLTNLVQQGIMPPDQGAQLARELPAPGDVAGLRDFLIKHGLSAMDASKRLEMSIPKTEVRNMGGTDQQFQTNQFTGEMTPGPSLAKTATPDAVMTDQRARSEGAANRAKDLQVAGMAPDGGIDQNSERTAQAIASGQLPAPTGMALLNPKNQRILGRVMEINPEYDSTTVDAKKKAARDFSTGNQGNAMRSFAVAGDHLDQLGKLVDALGNGNAQVLNKLGNAYSEQTGNSAPTNFDAAKDVVSKEVVKAIVAGGGGVAERAELSELMSKAKSPAQLKGVIAQYRNLMAAQHDALLQQRRAAGLSDSTLPSYHSSEAGSNADLHKAADAVLSGGK